MRSYATYPIFLNYLKCVGGLKILDISCRTGFLLKTAEEIGLTAYGLDLSEDAVKVAKKTAKNSEILIGAGENLCYKNEVFDYISWGFNRGTEQKDISETLLSFKQWENLFERNGLKILNTYHDKFRVQSYKNIKILEKRNPVIMLFRFIKKYFGQYVPLTLPYQFVFICERRNI